MAYAKQGLQLARELKFKTGEILIMINTGFAFGVKGDYAQSLSTLLNALQLAESLGNKNLIVKAKDAIGWSYSETGNPQKSLDYYYQVLDDEKENVGIYMFMGYDFLSLNKIDSAQYFAEQGYALDLKNKTHFALIYNLMADISLAKGKYREAIRYIYPFTLSDDNVIDYLSSCNHIAGIYFQIGEIDSAILCAKKVVNIKKQASMITMVLSASGLLTEIYASKKKNIDSAFKYQGMMLFAKDSLFSQEKVKALQNIEYKEAQRQQDIVAAQAAIINRVRMYILIGIAVVFLLFGIIILRNYRKQKRANEKIQMTLAELKSTQSQLIQSEKMASLGELTAGIAHEIQNPLNFVNNFSEVNKEMIDELKNELAAGNQQLAIEIADDIKSNEEKINHHGKRADAIVKGMLQHSRSSTGVKEPTDINALADEYLRLAYHGLRAKDKSFNATMKTDFDESIGNINIIPQDIGRVILNLITNAFYVVDEKKKSGIENYEPTVSVSTKIVADKILISVKDNGNGIPQKVLDKIFQPFFTTKPTGQGTGLGLSLSYDIVKAHGGEIKVETKEGEARPDDPVGRGTEFIIQLPT